LKTKLRDEADFILGWAIEGAVKYYKNGLHRSPHVVESGSTYFTDADFLEQWIEERCIVEAGAVSAVADLFSNHSFWAEEACIKATLDKGRFSQRLKAKGYEHKRQTLVVGKQAVRVIVGLRLRPDEEMPFYGVVREGDKF
jgi:phage/plasmid-associated DNA primase